MARYLPMDPGFDLPAQNTELQAALLDQERRNVRGIDVFALSCAREFEAEPVEHHSGRGHGLSLVDDGVSRRDLRADEASSQLETTGVVASAVASQVHDHGVGGQESVDGLVVAGPGRGISGRKRLDGEQGDALAPLQSPRGLPIGRVGRCAHGWNTKVRGLATATPSTKLRR